MPEGSSEIISIREDLLDRSLQGIDAFFDKTDDWERATSLVKIAKQFAIKAIEKEDIKTKVEQLQEFGAKQSYWHCKGYFNKELPPDLF